ncbi:glutamate--cysteine ligase [Alkaliphilus hydrothermalis]|uniref:Glutamate--cysteine ligase n=1 Tax=Alkaliphilus hydrothermalis TaxID=1482730 RepID=A0ABS2NQ08_9FIRM|nr:glutamate-cysteine ligase family protein [Alkaliphilus hydrothermalis]MBM7614996.1 glutamate--cysteine ligase [Alkaliphilus hydrothermalis]
MTEEVKIQRIIDIIKNGEKAPNRQAIGAEFEHIVVDGNSFDSVNYYQEKGIESILKELQRKGYDPIKEGSYLVGLEKPEGVITLEPGGQLELSVPPSYSLRQIDEGYVGFLHEVLPILEDNNQLLLALGYHPKTSIKDIPFNPKKRYEYMSNYLKNTGTHAHNMMKGTAAIQTAIDYTSEEDFIKKFRVANFLSPVLALVSDNSPIFEGEVYENNSIRSVIWENTDKQRSGTVKGVMDQTFGYREYAQYILGVPPILFIKDGKYLPTGNMTTSQVMGENDLTEDEVEHLLTMVFPDVRAKRYVEIRMGDSLPYPLNISYIALIKGIFYHQGNLDRLYNLSLDVTDENLAKYKVDMIQFGFEATFMDEKIGAFIQQLMDMAEKGLPTEETLYLAPLKDLLAKSQNPAMVSKEMVKTEGVKGVLWTAQNHIIRREHSAGKEVI